MLYNSFEYIFVFLPPVMVIYFLLGHRGLPGAARAWLLLCSIFYYSYWNISHLPLIAGSTVINFGIGWALAGGMDAPAGISRRALLRAGVLFNLFILGYYKYTGFFIETANTLFGAGLAPLNMSQPVGISYFTFIQIAFVVAAYRGAGREGSILNYGLFSAFFPQILSGPIVYHKEMIRQYTDPGNTRVNYDNIMKGVLMFSIGLFKKTVIADSLAVWAVQGFDHAQTLNFFEAWFTSLSFTFQLYNDFSGCIDMANGIALMLNIRFPLNFDSPYKSLSLQEYWRKFHMTLIRFLRDHVYIPLGGSRKGQARLYLNIMAIFIVAGLWHGATLPYVAWGAVSGVAMIINRLWSKSGRKMGRYPAWFVTFNFVNIANLIFRAPSLGDAGKILKGMAGLNGVMLSEKLSGLTFLGSAGIGFGKWLDNIGGERYYLIYFLVTAALIAFLGKNARELSEKMKPDLKWGLFVALLLGAGLLHMTQVRVFLYFNY